MSLIKASRSVPGGVNGLGVLDLFLGQGGFGVFGQHLRQNQQVVERRAQLVAHVGQELALVLGGERKLFGLLFQRRLGLLHLAVLGFHLVLLFGQQVRFFFQLGVGLLKLLGQRLALLQQLFGAHGGGNRVQHDADALRELVQERQVDVGEMAEGSQLDHRLRLAFEQHRQHDDAERRSLAQAGGDLDVVFRNVGHQDAALFPPALAHQSLPHARTASGTLSLEP